MKKSIFTVLLIAVLALSMMFVSCSKSSSETATTSTGSSSASAAPAAKAEEKPRTDMEISVANTMGWETLSPFRSNIGNNLTCWSTIVFETLGYLDGTNTLVPWIAKEWSTDDNGMSYTIKIWDYITDAKGNKITADDVVWATKTSMEKALKPNYKKVKSIEKVDDYTVKVTFKSNQVGVFETFMTDTPVCSQKAYEAQGDDFVNSCVSTSPYVCTNFVSGSSATFERREDYWQSNDKLCPQLRPQVKKVRLDVIPEAAQLGIALETNVVDFVTMFPASTAVQFDGDKQYTLQRAEARNGMQIYFSGAPGKAVADDVYLRQAICYAIDNNLMISAVLEGFGDVMHDSASTYAIGYQDAWRTEDYYPYNVEKAKECLAKSNYHGEELELLANSTMKTTAEIIQNNCAAVGIKVKLNLVQQAILTAIRLDGTKYDMFINKVGGISLANHWDTRYNARAYKTGDATSRHDMALADMIAETSTVNGFTPENINKVRNYIKDNAYGYGMYQEQQLAVWNNNLKIKEVVNDNIKAVVPTACIY